MDELKNTVPAASEVDSDKRRTYAPPTAEIILLAPTERLTAWDYGYHNDSDAGNRWALNAWGYSVLKDTAASAVTNVIEPTDWTLPET